MIFKKLIAAAGIATALTVAAGLANAEEKGVTSERILFGQVAAFDGPAGALGTGMNLGIKAAFEEANRAGGVFNRKLEIVTMDDGYEPDRSIKHTQHMIEGAEVFGLIGPVGTPTSRVTQPIATRAKVPFVGPFTGAGFLRDATLGNVVNLRATYGAETEAWIKYLVDENKKDKIAILYQDDAFGRVGLSGVQKALESRDMNLVAKATYQRNTTAVKMAVLDIRAAKPDAVVMVGAYKPIAEFIKVAKSIEFAPEFVTISFVGSAALAAELGKDGEGVVISQVVPSPWDSSLPVVAEYTAALVAVAPEAKPDFISLEGYLVGRLAIAALRETGAYPTREAFLSTIWKTGTFDLGGVTLTYGPEDNQGSDGVYMTRITADGSFEQVNGLEF